VLAGEDYIFIILMALRRVRSRHFGVAVTNGGIVT